MLLNKVCHTLPNHVVQDVLYHTDMVLACGAWGMSLLGMPNLPSTDAVIWWQWYKVQCRDDTLFLNHPFLIYLQPIKFSTLFKSIGY